MPKRFTFLAKTARLVMVLAALASVSAAQEAADFFRQNCASCHTIGGGRITGPDLKGVTQRKDRDWLVRFLNGPQAMIDSGDPYAAKLQQEARGVVMPTVSGMSSQRASALLDMIEAESKLERSQFAGLNLSDQPFTPADVQRGMDLFRGTIKLAGGGPSCISCHTVKNVAALGGGRLGPDLTLVYERLGGRKALASWLQAPALPTMQATFGKQALQSREIVALVAYLEDAARKGGQDDSVSVLNFFLMSLGGAAIGLVVFDVVWKRRFRSVRRALVQASAIRGEQS